MTFDPSLYHVGRPVKDRTVTGNEAKLAAYSVSRFCSADSVRLVYKLTGRHASISLSPETKEVLSLSRILLFGVHFLYSLRYKGGARAP